MLALMQHSVYAYSVHSLLVMAPRTGVLCEHTCTLLLGLAWTQCVIPDGIVLLCDQQIQQVKWVYALQWLVFFRFWVGLGLGGVPVSFTLYMELMPTKGRGVWLIWLEVHLSPTPFPPTPSQPHALCHVMQSHKG